MDLLAELPPFEERGSFDQLRNCLALDPSGEIVRIKDWIRDHSEHGYKVLLVRACDPASPGVGMEWEADSTRLTPIKSIEGAHEQAQAWRADLHAREIGRNTPHPPNSSRPSRL